MECNKEISAHSQPSSSKRFINIILHRLKRVQKRLKNNKKAYSQCSEQCMRGGCSADDEILDGWVNLFQDWNEDWRRRALSKITESCKLEEAKFVMKQIEPHFQRDFISFLPKELALHVLSYLRPKDILNAAQTCRYWRGIADDNLLWQRKCFEMDVRSQDIVAKPGKKRFQMIHWKKVYQTYIRLDHNWRNARYKAMKVLKGHNDYVITCLHFYNNKIISASDDNTVKIWSASTGKCLKTLCGHTGGVWASQLHNNYVISGSTDRTLKVWDVDSGACIHTLSGHTSTVRCLHACDTRVVSGSRDATLRLWNIEDGKLLKVLISHVAAVRCVQFDGKHIISGAYDFLVKVWNPDTGLCLRTLQGHSNRVYSLQFDGIHIVSGSLDTSIRVWNIETGECEHVLTGHQSLTSGMQLKNNTLASGNADSTVKIWDIRTGQCLQTLEGRNKHRSAVTCLELVNKFVITSSDDGTVKVWDVTTGNYIRDLISLDSGGSGGVVWRICCDEKRLVCAVGSRNGTEETKLLILDFDV
ncbi:F-box/WD repeat-containing protein 7 [Trichoplax sp. H2]|nr:F-box/WD repeat-containing protein 7 [Trichoplax sp. H2]|eukprot:RDD47310.1 F-box/WD repeat-containing protein 7 [Trichoplax sp. H2]